MVIPLGLEKTAQKLQIYSGEKNLNFTFFFVKENDSKTNKQLQTLKHLTIGKAHRVNRLEPKSPKRR